MDVRAPSPDQSPAEQGYHVASEPGFVFSRFQLRDRIRYREILPETEIAAEGTDDYRPAGEFAELGSYFSLISRAPVGASPMVGSSAPVESVARRLIPAIIYPLKGMGIVLIIVAAALQVIPFVGLVAGVVIGVYGLAIARASSRGLRELPPLSEMGGAGEIITAFVKMVVIGVVGGFLPVLALAFVPLPAGAKLLAMLGIIALYLPASMAILARWKDLSQALSPSQVFGFIGTLGFDYFAAIASIFVVFAITLMAAFLPQTLRLIATAFLSVWAGFYMMHLLGWAMGRHADELPAPPS